MKKRFYALFAAILFLGPVFRLHSDDNDSGTFKCKVTELHPTQLAVGMTEVRDKENKFKKMSDGDLKTYLKDHPEPVVIGPDGEFYIIDHHHLARALYEIGVKSTYCSYAADYSNLGTSSFWNKLDEKKWVYPYDENGKGPLPYSAIPKAVYKMKDDPYRSLAAYVRDGGGYKKTAAPFAEFKWADFFRARFSKKDLENDFDGTVQKAIKTAHSKEASNLPGYIRN